MTRGVFALGHTGGNRLDAQNATHSEIETYAKHDLDSKSRTKIKRFHAQTADSKLRAACLAWLPNCPQSGAGDKQHSCTRFGNEHIGDSINICRAEGRRATASTDHQ
jgi:hypothetical protein